MPADDIVTIAHLSDLHLGASVEDTGGIDKASASSFFKSGD